MFHRVNIASSSKFTLALFHWFLLFQSAICSHFHPILTGPPSRIQSRNLKLESNLQSRGLFDRFSKKGNSPAPVFSTRQTNVVYRSHVQYAANAYCTNLRVGTKVGSDGNVLWLTGDGNNIQFVYIAYSPTLGIIISHEGTNSSSAASVANDLDFSLTKPFDPLNWLGAGVKIGRGFQEAWFDTAPQVLDQVKVVRQQYPDANIVVTGHSLGASTALLGALHLTNALNVPVSTIVFGLPRTGNQAFANAVDKYLPTQRHITHYQDPVPHLPARSFGFQHPSGEVWIANEQGSIVYQCPGQENSQCSNSVSLLHYEVSDHTGPYFGISMYCVT